MRHRVIGASILLVLLLTLSGCAGPGRRSAAPSASATAPTLASMGETVTVGDREYRAEAEFTSIPENREFLQFKLQFSDFGDPPARPGEIAVQAYGSDGRSLASPTDVGIACAGTIATPSSAELASLGPDHARMWGDIPYSFEVRAGETSISVVVVVAGQPEARWRLR